MSSKDITSPENRLEFLTHFVPLITNINSIELLAPSLYLGLFQNEYSELLMSMLASARVLVTKLIFYLLFKCKINYPPFSCNRREDWFCRWLYTPRADGKPRVMVSSWTFTFVRRIKKVEQLFKKLKRV
jgi:hypothetical protein